MYFLHGWPKSYKLPQKAEPVLAIRHSPDYALIAVVTASTLYIWSGDQHRIVLGHYTRTQVLISRDGDNEDVFWRPSGHLALTTKNGRIYFVDLFEDEGSSDLLKNPMDSFEGSGQRFVPKAPLRLILRGTFLISPTGIAWVYESHSKLHVCTHDGYIQRWSPTRDQFHLDEELPLYALSHVSLRLLMNAKPTNGNDSSSKLSPPSREESRSESPGSSGSSNPMTYVSPREAVANAIEDFVEDLAVTSIQYSPSLKMMLVAFQGGRAAVLTGNLEASLTDMKLLWLPLLGATAVSINSRKKILAVGLENGDVALFEADQTPRLLKLLSLNPWGITKRVTGAAKCLDWSPDGRVLAVGYAARGFSTWSCYGCRLNCSISQTNIMLSEQATTFFTPTALKPKRKSKDRSASHANGSVPSPPSSAPASTSSSTQHSSSIPKLTLSSESNSNGQTTSMRGSSASTQPSSPQPPLNTPAMENQIAEAALYGVHAMSWGIEGYSLLVSSLHTSKQGNFDQFHFVKACIAANLNLNHCQRILLQGSDRLLMLVNLGNNLGNLSWKHLQLPAVYTQDSWPLQLVSVSPDGSYIAVGGKKGFVLLNVATGTWSLFGDRMEEQSIKCIGISWYRHFLVAVVWHEQLKTHQVMFFPRTAKLAFSSLAFRANVPQNKIPTYLDCNDANLILFTTDAYFQYKILVDGENASHTTPTKSVSVTLKLTHQLGIDTPFDVTSVLLLPSNVVMTDQAISPRNVSSDEKSSTASSISQHNGSKKDTDATKASSAIQTTKISRSMAKLIVLDTNGNLSLTNAERSISMDLSKGIEQFWMANTEISDLGNSLWAYGERGLEVWFPFFTNSAADSHKQNYLTRERSLDFDLEVCPIGFLPQWGLIVGIGQGPSRTYSTNCPCFSYETKTQPFLHSVLKRMLEKGEIEPAVAMAKRYSAIAHFQHTLELLLHEALEAQHAIDHARSHRRKSTNLVASTKSVEDDSSRSSADLSSDPVALTSLQPSSGAISQTPSRPILSRAPSLVTLNEPAISSSARTSKSREKPKVLLRYVFEFLREFGLQIYTTVVVACARKTDPALWQTLFHPRYSAGKPRSLFEQCLSLGKLSVASSYLRVIQYTDGESESRRAALQCLDLCLKLDDLVLLRDLMRFLEPEGTVSPRLSPKDGPIGSESVSFGWSRTDSLSDTSQIRKEVESHTTGGYNEREEHFVLDDTLARYAKKLLVSQEMRTLIRFSKITRHRLRNWLSRERKRAAIVENYVGGLDKLHSDFSIPRPTHFPVEHLYFDTEHSMQDYSSIYFPSSDFLLKEANREAEEEEEDDFGVSIPGLSKVSSPSSETSESDLSFFNSAFMGESSDSVANSFKELEYLLKETIAAECSGWTLIVATILFRVPVIISVLQKHPIFWRVYKPMLEHEGGKGYTDLLAHISKQLGQV